MQHFKHAILQQNISILIHQFGSGFFMKGTDLLVRSLSYVNFDMKCNKHVDMLYLALRGAITWLQVFKLDPSAGSQPMHADSN
jgi:hypothetical protein